MQNTVDHGYAISTFHRDLEFIMHRYARLIRTNRDETYTYLVLAGTQTI